MPKIGDLDPRIEISGDAIYPVFRAIEADALARALLAKYDLQEVRKGRFYPARNYEALLGAMENRMPAVLKNIGRYICEEALLSPHIKNFEQLLMSMSTGYYRNHRGYQEGELGHYHCTKKSPEDYVMTLSGRYPCGFDQGIILGFAKKFGETITLTHGDDGCRGQGAAHCTLYVHVER